MIEKLQGLPDTVVGLEAVGTVTADDYEAVVIPAIEEATAGGAKARVLFLLDEEFEGFAAEAALDDARMGLHHWSDFEKIAFVSDHDLYRSMVKGFGFLMPGEVKVFELSELEDAKAWVTG